MPGPSDSKWSTVYQAASALAPAEDWRQELALATREAARADFAAVFTCAPDDWRRLQHATHPHGYSPLMDRIDREFKTRIDEVGEGHDHALGRHGRVYAPLDTAIHADLAEEIKDVVLRPASIEGMLVTWLVGGRGAMLGFVVVGAACDSGALSDRTNERLQQLSQIGGRTLGGAMDLAGACGMTIRGQVPGALGPLSQRERQITELVAEGLSNLNIGARLGIAETTVAVHLRRIFGKLGVRSRVQLAMRCGA